VERLREQIRQTELEAVPTRLDNAGEIRARWAWVEAEVWTAPMLTALENGVRGGKWFSLWDKVCAPGTLRAAFAKVKANGGSAGVDYVTVKEFEHKLEGNLERLREQLRRGQYQPQGIRRTWIDKPGSREKRPLGIPTVRDRVVQTALKMVLEPIFERKFAPQSYGFRTGRGCKDALRRVNDLLQQGYYWVVDADLKSCFDTIPHGPLLQRVGEEIADGRVLELLHAYVKAKVMETANGWEPEEGTPQGAVISPLLANIYLHPLDMLFAQPGVEMVRYADDFVILCRTEAEAQAAWAEVKRWTGSAGLTLHPQKTRLVDASQPGGFDFLGYHFERGRKWPRRKSEQRLRAKLRVTTRRSNGHSLGTIITNLNRTLHGWFEYFKHSSNATPFQQLDSWIRMRLRSILRRRHGGQGIGHGLDHFRWPNAYFTAQGLFSLVHAYAAARQSSTR
jgi:RNA-directed DNA polymerase